jgi:hypothetical protein
MAQIVAVPFGLTRPVMLRSPSVAGPMLHRAGPSRPYAPSSRLGECFMATLGDAKDSIYRGLRSLPRQPYLVAMWILGGELQALYAPWTDDEVTSLMASAMDLVREAAISGESNEVAWKGLELAHAWQPVIEAKDAVPGVPGALLNAWATFEGLAQEIGGLSGRYDGANWATLAAAERWRDWDEPGPIVMSRVNGPGSVPSSSASPPRIGPWT